jgi:AcrR family transcriptional regulator
VPADGRELRNQGRKTMASLLDAGMQVLAERGYHAARVDDVVRVADVSHGTFYLYFANKEALFRALAVQCADDMTVLASGLGPVGPGPEGVAELRRWLSGFIAGYRRFGVVIRAWMEDQITSRELARRGVNTIAPLTDTRVERNTEAREREPQAATRQAAALLAMVERFTYFATSRALDFDDDTVTATLATVIHRGFFAPPSAA